ncbi:MAG: host attachment family protein [Pseudomonadota bacterium]
MRDAADRIAWIAVADGEKALIFRNADTADSPLLKVVRKEEIDNPPNRKQGAGPAGRFQDPGAGGAQRSAVEETDWRRFEKQRFAQDFADALSRAALRDDYDELVVFAPAATLGVMREALGEAAKSRLLFAIDSDLTNHPVEEIEARVKDAYRERPMR